MMRSTPTLQVQTQNLASQPSAPLPEHPLTYDEFTALVQSEITRYAAVHVKQRFDELYERQLIDEASFKEHAAPGTENVPN